MTLKPLSIIEGGFNFLVTHEILFFSVYVYMKKIIVVLILTSVVGILYYTQKGKAIKNIALTYVTHTSYVNEKGNTIKERILIPEGFSIKTYTTNSFSDYVQNYSLKPFGAQVINYDGNPYSYQDGHVGVLEIPVPTNGLQQCADALMRIRAEYLWETNQKEKIGFNFTSGHYCSWKKYEEGFRPKINGNKVSFHKTVAKNSSKENFHKYLNLIYMYAGTQSLYDELPKINSINNVEVGDMLIYPGSPGHVIMVVDKAINSKGENLFIFAQGNTPAQSVHIIKNPTDSSISPWFKIEIGEQVNIPTYYFDEAKFMRFK